MQYKSVQLNTGLRSESMNLALQLWLKWSDSSFIDSSCVSKCGKLAINMGVILVVPIVLGKPSLVNELWAC